jgi:hypothetical protein
MTLALSAALATLGAAGDGLAQVAPRADGARDFDFFLGRWTVKHRRLRKRLAGSDDWEEFDGTTTCQSLLGGMVNINESVSMRGGVTSQGLGLRAFDAKTGDWADWYLSGGDPTRIDAPGIGRFANGIGTFLSDDSFEGRPIKVRGVFTPIRPGLAQWEQAFSPNGGGAWETNWVMRYTRIG